MSLTFKISGLILALCCSCGLSQATPNIEIYVGEQSASTISELRGELQVRADKTSVDASTGRAEASGHIVITNLENGRRRMTLRADKAKFSSADAEFQITDIVKAEFADGSAFINRALSDGYIAGYAEGALLQGIEDNPGWNRYRLHYQGAGAGAGYNGNIAFDAQNQILKIYESVIYSDAKTWIDKRVYIGVTQEILEQAINNSSKDKATNFRNLTRYGAKLQSSSKR